jgi:2-phospho-L-lactate guanylyltransferase
MDDVPGGGAAPVGVHALVPVKALSTAKTRLAEAFDPAQRRALVEVMLADVLAAVGAVDLVDRVAVVTSDEAAAGAAAAHGVPVVSDAGLPWNEGLVHAIGALDPTPGALIVVAADLPALAPQDLEALLAVLPPRGVAVGRAHDGGTNVLALRPPDAIVPTFGVADSAARHVERARAARLEVAVLARPGLAFDLDTPADAARLVDRPGTGRVRELLLGYRNRSDSGARTSSAADPSPAAP